MPIRFIPPHCPRSDCAAHTSREGFRWVRYGTYATQGSTTRTQRFRCLHCRSTFSATAFTNLYYAKRPELFFTLAHRIHTCAGYRQMKRELRCAHSTLMRQAARIGRQALLRLASLAPTTPMEEPLVIDGFETFGRSQYHPCYINLAVGAESHYTYGFTFSAMRRKGRMTDYQLRKRAGIEARYGRPDPRAIELGTAALLRTVCPLPQSLLVRSDEHTSYLRAFRSVAHLDITHERTPSVEARTTGNPLFAVNLADHLLRHNCANQKRETIAYSKHAASIIERVAWMVDWRNRAKQFSENHGGGTPAMRAGLTGFEEEVEQLCRWRLFPRRTRCSEEVWRYYWRLEHAPGMFRARPHQLRYAF